MTTIVRTIGIQKYLDYLQPKLPGAIWVSLDQRRTAMQNFFRALQIAGTDAALHLEDDIILTQGFHEKIAAAIAAMPDQVIQFFSLKGTESKWQTRFIMAQCFYIPAGGIGCGILGMADAWMRANPQHPNGLDLLMSDYLRANRIKHYLHIPSLVQHRSDPSNISPRSRFRQSISFVNPWN